MSTVDRLVGSFDLDRDRGLAALYHGDLFVVTLDGLAGWELVRMIGTTTRGKDGKRRLTLGPD